MFTTSHAASLVTAVLPNHVASRVAARVRETDGATALVSKARGTLLQESWWRQWLPAISPAKTKLQMLVAANRVEPVIAEIIELGNLHRQSTGAVFSTPVEEAYIGSDCRMWQDTLNDVDAGAHAIDQALTVTFCIVGNRFSEKIARAAILAGAHGPIIYHSEGRGLRDRLGWLRITKEHDKDVLAVIADQSQADQIFDAMAKAGELHLPGRGFMYRLVIDRGIVNLPSRVTHHRTDANFQQVIRAIDHLTGHADWRDQSVRGIGDKGRAIGLDLPPEISEPSSAQVCLTAVIARDNADKLMEFLLDQGAPGVNISYHRLIGDDGEEVAAGARIVREYAVLRCIAPDETARELAAAIDAEAEAQGLTDLCVLANPVCRIATYMPGLIDYRSRVA